MITPEQIKQDKQIKTYIERADDTLQALGYTEHSFAHVTRVLRRRYWKSWAMTSAPASLRG